MVSALETKKRLSTFRLCSPVQLAPLQQVERRVAVQPAGAVWQGPALLTASARLIVISTFSDRRFIVWAKWGGVP